MGHDPKDASPVYALAESHELSADGKVYTFKLRPTAKWSNGEPVTAHDFVKTYKRILNPGVASEYDYLHHLIENAEAYEKGDITEERLAHSVKKILQAKYKVGLNNYKPIKLYNLSKDLQRIEDDILYEDLMESAITVVKHKNDLLPIRQANPSSHANFASRI